MEALCPTQKTSRACVETASCVGLEDHSALQCFKGGVQNLLHCTICTSIIFSSMPHPNPLDGEALVIHK